MLGPELRELVENSNGETRNIEFKRSMSWDDKLTKLKLIKSILAMSNIRDGGMIIIGVNQQGNKFYMEGLNPEHAKSFNYDHVSMHVAVYADPYARFSLKWVTDENNVFIVISVHQFDQSPILCKKDFVIDGRLELERGKLYTRTWRLPESSEVSTLEDLREIIELAIEKGVARFVALASKSGLASVVPASSESNEPFNYQLNEFLSENGRSLGELKAKGYWKVLFRPTEFKRERLRLHDCKVRLESSIVTLRSYNYPHYYGDAYNKIGLGTDYVFWSGRVSPERFFVERAQSIWRMYQSELFIHFFALLEDYWKTTASMNVVSFTNLVWTITEIYKFAANLALKDIIDGQLIIQVELHNSKHRQLVDLNTSLHNYHHECTVESLRYDNSILSMSEVIAHPLELALNHTSWILERFDINPQSQFWVNKMKEKQQEVLDRKKYFPFG